MLPHEVVARERFSSHDIRRIGRGRVEVDPPRPALRRARADAVLPPILVEVVAVPGGAGVEPIERHSGGAASSPMAQTSRMKTR